MTFDDIIDMKVGSTSVESAWFNGQQVWPTATTGTRTGNVETHKSLPVQSLTKDGTVTSDTDQTKYEDGTDIDKDLLKHLD